jgi:pyridoxine 5-phosphate synthase
MNRIAGPDGPLIELEVNLAGVYGLRAAGAARTVDPIEAALAAERAGADVIVLALGTRHAAPPLAEAQALGAALTVDLCLEIELEAALIEDALLVRPGALCLDGRLPPRAGAASLAEGVRAARAAGLRVGALLAPTPSGIDGALDLGVDFVKLDTTAFAVAPDARARSARLAELRSAADRILRAGRAVHAGGALDEDGVVALAACGDIDTLCVGQALVAAGFYKGWERAVRSFKGAMIEARVAVLCGSR